MKKILGNDTIYTERLEITPFEEKFITNKYINWLNDPKVVKFSNQRFCIHTKESCEEYLDFNKNSPNIFWAIIEKTKNYGHIGNITAYIDINHNTAEIAILIGEKQVWGKGYGFEAWKAVCDFLFSERSIRKVTAGTLACNYGMVNVAKKYGMEMEGRRIRQEIFDNIEVDIIYFGLFNPNI
jgi:RimJ/RimL family protein N-acetyltransferase|tara:strand:+ start:152 stop:697 length:546 start_codon:yes stop_codon:yes gene_type:complete